MRVWITRTEPGATRLADALEQLGMTAFRAPALRIEQREVEAPQGPFDFALFVSEHAVAHAASNGWSGASWRGCPTAAIGAAANAALQARGIIPCMTPQADAASVFSALRPLPARTLVVKGEGGRDILQRKLRQRGKTVVEWEVYRRVGIAPNIAAEAIDAIVVGSGEGVRFVAKAWFGDGRDASTPLLAPSPRVAALAADSGFTNVVATLGANPAAVAAALVRLPRKHSRERELG